MTPAPEEAKKDASIDIYRDTLLRYAGYANEVGESLKPLVHNSIYLASYAISIAYVVGDARDKFLREPDRQLAPAAGTNAFIWQALASVIIPGFVINRIVYIADRLTPPPTTMSGRYAPTLIGLSCIPLIIQPIDRAVDFAMENAIGPAIDQGFLWIFPKSNGQSSETLKKDNSKKD
mmetsp:Transcript_13641/g.18183  ORF Transcript_13641/g.18183 Transcript_13641/m.18183 type:complete len:177 (+) Transcript_13641:33-563(+)